MTEGMAFDDAGKMVPYGDFDWDAVEKAFAEDLQSFKKELEEEPLSPREIERIYKGISSLLKWSWQGGMKNPEGLHIRTIILHWIVLKELHPLPLTDLATMFGKKKQSFGRWVDNFKQFFSWIRSPHMRWK